MTAIFKMKAKNTIIHAKKLNCFCLILIEIVVVINNLLIPQS